MLRVYKSTPMEMLMTIGNYILWKTADFFKSYEELKFVIVEFSIHVVLSVNYLQKGKWTLIAKSLYMIILCAQTKKINQMHAIML